MNQIENAYGLKEARLPADLEKGPSCRVGRVLSQEKGLYRIVTDTGEQRAEVSGKFRFRAETAADYPAVGDFVAAEDNPGGNAIIQAVLPRKSVFLRKAAGTGNQEQVVAANVDTVFLCMSLNQDFNLRRLERYLAVAWESGACPVVVLTKTGLCPDREGFLAQVEGVAMGADIVFTSSADEEGYHSLLPYLLPGKTIAAMGSSGVGKSTLINHLLGEARLETNGLRDDDKGRHTTTHRELFLLKNGAMVIDTPGMRELGLWDAGEGLSHSFADIEALAARCRFRDCTHSGEPHCAIAQVLQDGSLSPERWASYQKLRKENSFCEDAGGYLSQKKKKFKAIAKQNKNNLKR